MMATTERRERAQTAAKARWDAEPKSNNKMFALRLPPVMRAALEKAADDEGVTMTALIIEVLAARLGLPVPVREAPEIVTARRALAKAQEKLREALEHGKATG